MTEERKPPPANPWRGAEAAAENERRAHPQEDADLPEPSVAPEDEEAVPVRYLANIDAAPLPWPERPK